MKEKEQREGSSRITFQNFYLSTRATFKGTKTPSSEPDFVSPSGSAYWDLGEGVVRSSDHWAGRRGCLAQASCVWDLLLDEKTSAGPVWQTGFCSYDDFYRRDSSLRLLPVSDNDRAWARLLKESGGVLVDYGHRATPVWAKVSFPGSLFCAPEAIPLLDAGARRVLTAPEGIVDAINGGCETIEYGRAIR